MAFTNKEKKFFKRELQDNTIVTYLNRVKRVHRMLFPNEKFTNVSFLHNLDNCLKIIDLINKSDMTINVKVGIYTAIIATYDRPSNKAGYKLYTTEFQNNMTKRICETREQLMNVKENSMYMDIDDLLKGLNKMQKHIESFPIGRDFMIMNLMILLPPRREKDYALMGINTSKEDENSFETSDGKFEKFIFRNYKGSKNKGIQVFNREFMTKLPNGDEILKILDWWTTYNTFNYFLGPKKLTTTFGKLVVSISKKVFDKPVNINLWRHFYITRFLEKNPYYNEKHDVAQFMSHTMEQQELYRKKVVDKNCEEVKEDLED